MTVVKQYMSVKFKLHTPSKKKKAIILDAMQRTHLAYDKLLKHFRPAVEDLVSLNKASQRKCLKKLETDARSLVKPLSLGSGPKQAVQIDFIAQVKSYLALKDEDEQTGYPVCQKLKANGIDFEEAITRLAASTTKEEEDAARDDLASIPKDGILRPISIYKNRLGDGALLLQDNKGRYFAFINLLPAKNRHCVSVDLTGLKDLRTGQVLDGPKNNSSGIFVQLQAARWQIENFNRNGCLQSSKLIYRNGDFYFIGTYLFEAEPCEPVNFIGIDRGIENLAAYAVISADGEPIETGYFSGASLRADQKRGEKEQAETQKAGKRYSSRRRNQEAKSACHYVANEISDLAEKHNARVVMEKLDNLKNGSRFRSPKGQKRSNFNVTLSRQQYGRIPDILNSRLGLIGHEKTRRNKQRFHEVHAAYTSRTCHRCGHEEKGNRQSQDKFECMKCGHRDHADINAAINIAQAGRHLEVVVGTKKKGQKLKQEELFKNWYKLDIEKRGQRESVSYTLRDLEEPPVCAAPAALGSEGSKADAVKNTDASSSLFEYRSKNSIKNRTNRKYGSVLRLAKRKKGKNTKTITPDPISVP